MLNDVSDIFKHKKRQDDKDVIEHVTIEVTIIYLHSLDFLSQKMSFLEQIKRVKT